MRHALLSLFLLTAPACALNDELPPSERSADGIRTTRTPELHARLLAGGRPTVLDVRTPAEFADGHIDGAINVPLDQLKARLPSLGLDPAEEVYVTCEAGARSRAASQTLAKEGYLPVDLEDGMGGWRWKGYPTKQ
jgi:phage shock protein E